MSVNLIWLVYEFDLKSQSYQEASEVSLAQLIGIFDFQTGKGQLYKEHGLFKA